ncbi:hypothetical protein FA15DRAFT_662526 [Coprinopsis marcescibilis]|uniref:FAM192A/Fyv6 N-terminal domain-containing protein n=1 Tax=Coprinopsis marcescibilis TaxID=230819 RepID=A0A5C3LPA1_COPMA|nr:hypothetical protein FA15DRAFT_662526 [Coprinopsis marcescibilis]
MDPIPSLSDGVVGSRFVSQDDIETARARKDEQWKAAYARLGQEPPPQQLNDETYDGRSLAEKLAANKIAKQEEWEEKNKLANQFRALEEDEIMFLDSIREKQEQEERLRKETEGEELKNFREAVATRNSTTSNPPPSLTPSASAPRPVVQQQKKRVEGKRVLKGIVVKKKATKPSMDSQKVSQTATGNVVSPPAQDSHTKRDGDDAPDPKRRRISKS